jgi:hypothetical protein
MVHVYHGTTGTVPWYSSTMVPVPLVPWLTTFYAISIVSVVVLEIMLFVRTRVPICYHGATGTYVYVHEPNGTLYSSIYGTRVLLATPPFIRGLAIHVYHGMLIHVYPRVPDIEYTCTYVRTFGTYNDTTTDYHGTLLVL